MIKIVKVMVVAEQDSIYATDRLQIKTRDPQFSATYTQPLDTPCPQDRGSDR